MPCSRPQLPTAGWTKQAILETLLGIKRAGADLIITYHAIEAARTLAGPVTLSHVNEPTPTVIRARMN